MSHYYSNHNHDSSSVPDSFDKDYSASFSDHNYHHNVSIFHHSHGDGALHPVSNVHDFGIDPTANAHNIFQYDDPLKHAHEMNYKPLQLQTDHFHFVDPHHVNGYFRQDGTYVKGYFRDGDGNTSVDRSLEQGGGYLRKG